MDCDQVADGCRDTARPVLVLPDKTSVAYTDINGEDDTARWAGHIAGGTPELAQIGSEAALTPCALRAKHISLSLGAWITTEERSVRFGCIGAKMRHGATTVEQQRAAVHAVGALTCCRGLGITSFLITEQLVAAQLSR